MSAGNNYPEEVSKRRVFFDFNLLFGVHHSNDVNTKSPR